MQFAGSGRSIDEAKFYSKHGFYNGPSLCGFLGPGSQGRANSPVQGFMGCTTPVAQFVRTQIKNRRLRQRGIQRHLRQ